jgi:hypothetical protein
MKEALAARRRDSTDFEERWEKVWAYSRESGREAAMKERNEIDSQADRIWKRMIAIPAATQAGRAAKVRALLAHVCTRNGKAQRPTSIGIKSRHARFWVNSPA